MDLNFINYFVFFNNYYDLNNLIYTILSHYCIDHFVTFINNINVIFIFIMKSKSIKN